MKRDTFLSKLHKMDAVETKYTFKPTFSLKNGPFTTFIYVSDTDVTMWRTKMVIGDKPWSETFEKVGETLKEITFEECLETIKEWNTSQ